MTSDKIDDSYDFPISVEERNKIHLSNNLKKLKFLKLDKLEAKTLYYCVRSLNILI
jgi:hypothetical protein